MKARRARGRWIAVAAAAVIVIAVTAYAVWSPSLLSASGSPKLVVDRTVIDFGDVSYGKFVTAQFMLKNEGDGVLTITETPIVRAVRGC